jgi:diguanylate cyclase (GGDEF)-like protein
MNQSWVDRFRRMRWLHPALRWGLLAAVYFGTARVGLTLAVVNPSATAFWPPSGIALAALLRLGYGVWPGILVGAFLANVTTAGSVATSIAIAIGNTLEGVIGAYLVNRFANGARAAERARDVFGLATFAAVYSTAVSASVGVTALALGGYAAWSDYGSIWLTWWLGDATGDLVVAPALLLWSANPRIRWTRNQALEAAALLASLVIVALIAFGGLVPSRIKTYPLEFLGVPFLLWAAFRFGQREAATAVLVQSLIAVWGTHHGFGPFVRGSENQNFLLLQAYAAVTAVMTLALAAVVSERREVEERLRHLAASDPLTGLANYRHLIQVLEGEVQRSARTGHPFAILLIDLDGLKRINDLHGHLVGSRALCRVAEALRASSRVVDTPARFGGDEFALVLPETEEAAAQQVALRLTALLAQDTEQPPVKVTTGIAMFPQDGATVEAVLNAADRALYAGKSRRSRDEAAGYRLSAGREQEGTTR